MKRWRIIILLVTFFMICGIFYFLDTRIWINKYGMKGNTLVFENNVYLLKDSLSESDTSNHGKTIGIAVNEKRSITNYIWPNWILEYKNDKYHNHIFVRGIMDMGNVYIKQA
ncbi:hypothetical protein [Cohnella lupini]|uniref:Uncharacterized protein n=1 Tax=Cohnella lupini TaxID=1294267 RepID=A0A3D9IWN9_9BACL|nr:hypothetical protein [Cohnella lupini]RED66131.1 hypothetical protein DFP95_101629 [Cohnella lupini]